jgi:hypothetical protein
MSAFYCEWHDALEDSDEVGYNLIPWEIDGGLEEIEVCDDALSDIEHEVECPNADKGGV